MPTLVECKVLRKLLYCVSHSVVSDSFVTLWAVALPGSSVHSSHLLLQGNLPDPGIEPVSPALRMDSLPSEPPGKPRGV